MLASGGLLALSLLLQCVIQILASPLLDERSNRDHLRCTNAPTVVAGYYLDPKEAQPPNSASATCHAAWQYLYCIPGTYTYIFFGTIKPSSHRTTPYATALNSSVSYIHQHIASSGDGNIPDGVMYLSTTGTNVQINGQDSSGHHLTWGVFGAALKGLNAWMGAKKNGYSDATFQINDGKNEVGNGYIGTVNEKNICVFANAFVPNTTCVAVDSAKKVYGTFGAEGC